MPMYMVFRVNNIRWDWSIRIKFVAQPFTLKWMRQWTNVKLQIKTTTTHILSGDWRIDVIQVYSKKLEVKVSQWQSSIYMYIYVLIQCIRCISTCIQCTCICTNTLQRFYFLVVRYVNLPQILTINIEGIICAHVHVAVCDGLHM